METEQLQEGEKNETMVSSHCYHILKNFWTSGKIDFIYIKIMIQHKVYQYIKLLFICKRFTAGNKLVKKFISQ
jgi:hypothetical protein